MNLLTSQAKQLERPSLTLHLEKQALQFISVIILVLDTIASLESIQRRNDKLIRIFFSWEPLQVINSSSVFDQCSSVHRMKLERAFASKHTGPLACRPH